MLRRRSCDQQESREVGGQVPMCTRACCEGFVLWYRAQTTNEGFFFQKPGNPKRFDKPRTRTTEMYSIWFEVQGEETENLRWGPPWGFPEWTVKDSVCVLRWNEEGEKFSSPRRKPLGEGGLYDLTLVRRFFSAFLTAIGLSCARHMNRRGWALTSGPGESSPGWIGTRWTWSKAKYQLSKRVGLSS